MSELRAAYRVTYADNRSIKRAIGREVKRLGASEPSIYVGPEPELILALLKLQDWTQTEVAGVLRVDVSAVRRWCADREQTQFRQIPFAAWWLLLHRAGVVPADSLVSSNGPAY